MKCALLLAIVLLAPVATAHFSDFSQFRTLSVGPFGVTFEPKPIPPFANGTISLVAQVSDNATSAIRRDVPGTIIIGGPGGFNARKKMEPDGTGFLIASTTLPFRGNYSARMILTDPKDAQNYTVQTEFEVFPDIPYRIRPVDLAADVFIGERANLAFEIVDPITLVRMELPDLRVRIEHWSDDHARFLGSQDEAASRAGAGVWRISPTVHEGGMYHIRFASDAAGFNYDDVPLVHVYAVEPPVKSPLPSLGLLAAAIAIVALLARRR